MNLKTWLTRWQLFSIREQAVLMVGAVAVILFLLWFALIKPLQASVNQQQLQNQSAEAALQRVRQLAAEYKQQQSGAASSARRETNLTQLVDSSLRQNDLRMSGFQPGSDGSVSLRFDNVPFAGLLQWLYEMEVGQGVIMSELSIRQGNAPGEVAATVRLRTAE